jgi:cell filamentation protein
MEQSITSMMIAQALIDFSFENVDFEFYKQLHKYVFSDIYDWTGTVRKVDMSKKGTNFCPADNIEKRGKAIF